jgi:zinc protease
MSVDRTIAPTPGVPRPYRFPQAERVTLESGAQLVVASFSKLPLVTATLVFRAAGAETDPVNREGLAQLTAAMLLEGTESLSGADIADRFEGVGTSLAAHADWDAAALSLTVQPDRLSDALRLLGEIIHAPAFPEAELVRLQAEHRADRLHLMAEPRVLADAAFVWCCYDETSRYRRPADGTMATTDAITREEIRAYWRARYTPALATLILAGDVTLDAAERLCEHLFAASAGEADASAAGAEPPGAAVVRAQPRYPRAHVSLVDKAGAAQTELRIGHVGVPRLHEDYHALTIANAILGGLFSSRINLNLRERHGYTYGAFSGFDWRRSAGPWTVSAAVNVEATLPAVQEVLGEVERIRDIEVGTDELALARDYLTGVFPLRFESTGAVAAALASQVTFGLPDDYFDTYRERLGAVSVHDVREVSARHFHPDAMQVVVVADRGTTEREVATLSNGSLSCFTPEEVEAAA